MGGVKNDTRREIVEAFVAANGRQSAAAQYLGCTRANIGSTLGRMDLLVQNDRIATLEKARAWLASARLTATVRTRSQPPETATVRARCPHPDRQEFSLGLCRECYAARRKRSMSLPVGAPRVDPEVLAQLEAEGPDVPDLPEPRRATTRARLGQDGNGVTEQQFRILEVLATGATTNEAARRLGLVPAFVHMAIEDVQVGLGERTLAGVFTRLGWVHPDYHETTARELTALLRRVDAAIHRAIAATERGEA